MPRQKYSKFMFLFFIRYVRNRIDHLCTVEPGNPNPRVHRSSGKLGEASFPTGTVDPRVGISLSPLNTNDGFSFSRYVVQLIHNLEIEPCSEKTGLRGFLPGPTQTGLCNYTRWLEA